MLWHLAEDPKLSRSQTNSARLVHRQLSGVLTLRLADNLFMTVTWVVLPLLPLLPLRSCWCCSCTNVDKSKTKTSSAQEAKLYSIRIEYHWKANQFKFSYFWTRACWKGKIFGSQKFRLWNHGHSDHSERPGLDTVLGGSTDYYSAHDMYGWNCPWVDCGIRRAGGDAARAASTWRNKSWNQRNVSTQVASLG